MAAMAAWLAAVCSSNLAATDLAAVEFQITRNLPRGRHSRGTFLLADAAPSDLMAAGKPLDLQVQQISGSAQNASTLLAFTQDAATPRP